MNTPETALGWAGSRTPIPVAGGYRAIHRQVLYGFATGGRAPGRAELAASAQVTEADAERALAWLHEHDLLRLDEAARIRSAYPFSAVPTGHRVRIEAGPEVFAMCAIDALGIAAMLIRAITVTSADPVTREEIIVQVAADGRTATWRPDSTVVYLGQRGDCAPCDGPATGSSDGLGGPAAEDVCCGQVNFFATTDNARTWAAAHPGVTGQILPQPKALLLATEVFGPLLDAPKRST